MDSSRYPIVAPSIDKAIKCGKSRSSDQPTLLRLSNGDMFEGMAMLAQAKGWVNDQGKPCCAPCLTVEQAGNY